MLLAIDVGNSNTSVGLFDKDKNLRFLASLDTDSRKTADQISIDLMNLFTLYHFSYKDVTGAILCSVVPPLNFMMEKALTRLLGRPPMVVGPGVKTGLNIRLTVQTQVGADIVTDAVAALEKFTPPIITIDMGTATTIGVISEGRTYEGGLLLPGVNVSLEALSRRAEKHRGLYAFRHRLWHRRNAGRHHRPHPGGIPGPGGERGGHGGKRPGDCALLPEPGHL